MKRLRSGRAFSASHHLAGPSGGSRRRSRNGTAHAAPASAPARGRPGAFELYLPYAPVQSAVAHDVHLVYALLAGGLAVLYLLLFRIVSRASRSLRRQAAKSRHQALHDSLTGLPNRRCLYERLDPLIADAERQGRSSRCCWPTSTASRS